MKLSTQFASAPQTALTENWSLHRQKLADERPVISTSQFPAESTKAKPLTVNERHCTSTATLGQSVAVPVTRTRVGWGLPTPTTDVTVMLQAMAYLKSGLGPRLEAPPRGRVILESMLPPKVTTNRTSDGCGAFTLELQKCQCQRSYAVWLLFRHQAGHPRLTPPRLKQ